MSAYIVSKEHITYIIAAATSRRLARGTSSNFSWYTDDATKPGGYHHEEIGCGDLAHQARAATMLWQENVRSVNHRYRNQSPAEEYTITPRDLNTVWIQIDPIQVLKSCDALEYQSCEHPEWKTSSAKSFLDTLRNRAWHSLPGYDDAAWGAPEKAPSLRLLTTAR